MKVLPIAWIGLAMACGGGDGRAPVTHREVPDQETRIQENRDAIRLEDRDLKLYAQREGMELQATGGGVRYRLWRDVEGPVVRPGEWAIVNYRLQLLNGDTIFASTPGRPEAFLVEMDDVESGLHEGIQLMSPGDSAILLIPSYRAHGLIGDMDRIPPRSTVIYHIGLVKVSGKPQGQ